MNIIKMVLYFIGVYFAVALLLFISSMLWVMYRHFRAGKPFPKGVKKEKKRSRFRRLFLDFPNQLMTDILNRDPFEFREYGVHIVVGEQGAGKTVTLVHLIQQWQKKYPKMKVASNIKFRGSTDEINHWKDVMNLNNGIYGQVIILDEIQGWFSSNQSRNFPPEMLTEISQQRKQRKAIFGTSQVFGRMAKPIREQTHFVYIPVTICGCLTIVRKSKAKYYNEEDQTFKRYTGTYFFVHNPFIRDSYDTMQKVEKYSDVGFSSQNQKMLRSIK